LHVRYPYRIPYDESIRTIDAIMLRERKSVDFFPKNTKHEILLCPDPDKTKIRSTQFGHHHFKSPNEQHVNHNRIPNALLSVVNGEHKFYTHILFPDMYLQQQDPAFVDKKYDFGTITLDDQQVFIDEIFLPCFREAVWRQKTLRFPKDFEQAQKKGYTTTGSVDFMSQYDLMGTIQNMRDFLKENPGYSKFDNFYFLTYSFGGKQDYPLFFTAGFQLKKGDKIDVGFDFMARNFIDPYEKSILFFDKTSVQCLDADYLLPVGGRKLKFHPQFMSTFGGFQFSSKRAKRFEKVIMYSSLKYDFSQVKRYGRNNDDYHPYLLRSIPKAIDNLFVSISNQLSTIICLLTYIYMYI